MDAAVAAAVAAVEEAAEAEVVEEEAAEAVRVAPVTNRKPSQAANVGVGRLIGFVCRCLRRDGDGHDDREKYHGKYNHTVSENFRPLLEEDGLNLVHCFVRFL